MRKGKYNKNNFFDTITWFCIGVIVYESVIWLLNLISKINVGVFFQWCGIISKFLSLPMSEFDLVIMYFDLKIVLFIFCIVFLTFRLYIFFKDQQRIYKNR